MQVPQKRKRLDVLQARLARAGGRLAELQKIENRFPWFRLAALVIWLLAAFLAFQLLHFVLACAATLLAFSGFVVVVWRHLRVIQRIERAQAFRRLLETHIARLKLDWEHIPSPTPLSVPPDHPFAADLNITGERSLHQLLDTAASLGGSQRLADWLLAREPDPAQITRRQNLVRELLPRAAFRRRLEEDGWLANPQKEKRWDGSALLHWLDSRRTTGSLVPALTALGLLAAANITLFALNAAQILPPLWIGTFILYFGLQSVKFRELSEVFDEAYTLARQLGQLRGILFGLENYPYPAGEQLSLLTAPLWSGSKRPSQSLRKISWIASAASLRNNPFLSLMLNILVPWDMFFAVKLEQYKEELGGVLPGWLAIWYDLEALTSLANFAVLNPENTFPVLLPVAGQPVFAGEAIGHPLIPDAARVNNNFILQHLGEAAIITGSNMSGKSTFLRTVGANLVLAYAGSTVAAGRLQALPFRLFTSMNLSDSLNDGISFFYAEVRRLKALLDQLDRDDAYPLFFLIDEIFRGTNNRERQVGSRAYSEALVQKNGAGLISTHDLELAHLAENIPAVHNYHFREEVADGRMLFDYTIHPGASPTTNALRIMELAGLPVPTSQKN